MVTSNLRALYVRESNEKTFLYFFYDNPPSEDEEELASLIVTEVTADFPLQGIDYKVLTLPCTQPVPQEGWCAYLRYEEDSDAAV